MAWDWVGDALVKFPAILLGIGLHEWSHAFVADRAGDPTPRAEGRVTLDLIQHLDPLGTVCFLFAPFGWGRAVPCVPENFESPDYDFMRVALAGPLMNLVLATGGMLSAKAAALFGPGLLPAMASQTLWEITSWMILLNVLLAVFNLIPIPPLDGSKVARYHLGEAGRTLLDQLSPIGLLLLIHLSYLGAFEALFGVAMEATRSLLSYDLMAQIAAFSVACGAWALNAGLLRTARQE